jgi:large subunit ribosomal protein L18
MPACYLTGLLAGAKAVGKGVSGGILYTGNRMFTPRIAAATKGLIDGGVKLAVDEEILPSEERINGKHIADYANMLKGDKGAYSARFPGLTKKGFAPENYPQHFEEVKASILDKGGKVEPRKKVEKTGEKEAKVKPEVKKEAKKEKKETKGERKKPLKKEGKKR